MSICHPRHHPRHQRADRAQGCAHRAHRHGGLSRCRSRSATRTATPQYDVYIEKPPPLVRATLRFGVPERMDVPTAACGSRSTSRRCARRSPQASGHESSRRRRPAARLRQRRARAARARHPGEDCPAVRHAVARGLPEVREYERHSTAVANAYVQPVMPATWSGGRAPDDPASSPALPHDCPAAASPPRDGVRFPIRLVDQGRPAAPSSPPASRERGARSAVLRHGRHDGQDLPDRRLPAAKPRAASRSAAFTAS